MRQPQGSMEILGTATGSSAPTESSFWLCVGRRALTPPHGRRRGFPCFARPAQAQSASRMETQRRCESTARISHRPIRVAERSRHSRHLSRGKDSKTMGFGGVLWVLSAAAGRKYPAGGICGCMRHGTGRTDCHSQFANWLRNDIIFCKGCSGHRRRGVVTPPYGWQGSLRKPGAGRCRHRPLRTGR